MKMRWLKNLIIIFGHIASNLGIGDNESYNTDSVNLSDPVNMAINKYSNHPSIIAIKTNCLTDTKHSFSAVSLQDIQNIVQSIDASKATASNSIPAGLFKDNIDLYIDIITNIVNKGILECAFPNLLKLADLIPAYKNGDVTDKSNYRPISPSPCYIKTI